MVLDWWGFSNRPSMIGKGQFWSSFNWLSNPREKMAWAITFSSIVWSLWLNRNVKVFNQISYNADEIVYLIKVKVQKWCQASSLLSSEHLVVWNVNPLRAITNTNNALSRELVTDGCKLFGFTDGSSMEDASSRCSQGECLWLFYTDEPLPNDNRSGIGVAIRDHKGRILRLFAGSLRINDRRENEFYAMFEGLIKAYLAGKDVVELETDNLVAPWE
ncbi:hypothetical protein POM88_037591 [Heracleum sosnowskyi]|uniref:RNase H type-1 domain-containing protein n=1 Tax=Heracleum sosnowskyi TaxID=360622 RepID=A0AAD8HQF3_9APIA|nr:hypothetical protein POM88_037591 [Heracleum sosnowskyi]